MSLLTDGDLNKRIQGIEAMKVTPIPGEALRFRVASESGRGTYLVDLSEDNGHGACGCQDFQMTVAKNRKKPFAKLWDRILAYAESLTKRQAKTDRYFCKHMAVCFAFFGWQMARQIAREAKRK